MRLRLYIEAIMLIYPVLDVLMDWQHVDIGHLSMPVHPLFPPITFDVWLGFAIQRKRISDPCPVVVLFPSVKLCG